MQSENISLLTILDTVSRLNETERNELLVALQKKHDGDLNSEKAKITDLAGLGGEIWHSVDIDKYVRDLRDEWDDRKVR
jgi:hypothetical protein